MTIAVIILVFINFLIYFLIRKKMFKAQYDKQTIPTIDRRPNEKDKGAFVVKITNSQAFSLAGIPNNSPLFQNVINKRLSAIKTMREFTGYDYNTAVNILNSPTPFVFMKDLSLSKANEINNDLLKFGFVSLVENN